MQKYIMTNDTDYRKGFNAGEHGVNIVMRENGIDTAYGYFKNIDSDMTRLTENEENAILNMLEF